MPRAPRVHVPGGFYHVTLRGNHRQPIFFTPDDRRLLDEIIIDALHRLAARLHAYCYMSNHIHLLIQVDDIPLGRVMLRIASRYARAVQSRLGTTGHLFERRHHPTLIDVDSYALTVLRYIHRNPVDAGIVDSISDYRWTSHHAYIGTVAQPWVTTDFLLSLFHSDRESAVDAYRNFMVDMPDRCPLEDLRSSNSRILGSDSFVARVTEIARELTPEQALDDLINEACRRFSVSKTDLQSRSRERHLTKARAWIAFRAKTLGITSVSQVAARLNRTEGSLRQSVAFHVGRSHFERT
jgi:putative transposase